MFARHGHAVAAQCYVMILSAEEWCEFSPRNENLEGRDWSREGRAGEAVHNRAGRPVYGQRKKTARGGQIRPESKRPLMVVFCERPRWL